MYWILGTCILCCGLLAVPRMEIQSPGEGIMAARPGTVTLIDENRVVVDDITYTYKNKNEVTSYRSIAEIETGTLVWPQSAFWQEPTVTEGDQVVKRQLIVRGVTHIFFQANVWIFTLLVFIVGIMMGVGKAAVYKYIPEYFPKDVGVVGGIVGVVGGLGGFVCPVIFGYMLRETGIWTTTWIFLFWVSVVCLIWLYIVARGLIRAEFPHLLHEMERETSVGMQTVPGGR
jgi:NNP family nitrate/nitrite transporter-like MFS transporter